MRSKLLVLILILPHSALASEDISPISEKEYVYSMTATGSSPFTYKDMDPMQVDDEPMASIRRGGFYSMEETIGIQSCAYNDNAGVIRVNYSPGCTTKGEPKVTKDGMQVTIQQTLPVMPGSKAAPLTEVKTYATTAKKGVLQTVSIGDGESLSHSHVVTTAEYESGTLDRVVVAMRKFWGGEKFVTYDRDLCSHLQDAAGPVGLEATKHCAKMFEDFQNAVSRMQKRIQSEGMKLGVVEDGKARAANVSQMGDLALVIARCAKRNGARPRIHEAGPSGVIRDTITDPSPSKAVHEGGNHELQAPAEDTIQPVNEIGD